MRNKNTVFYGKRLNFGGILHSLLYQQRLYHLFKVLCFYVVVALFVIGCVSAPKPRTSLANTSDIAALDQWRIKGKIAWITQQERTSAYLNWEKNQSSLSFGLTNVLGITLAKMKYDGNMATLTADGKTYTDFSASRLIAQTTGWQIPIANLQHWIKGVAAPEIEKSISADSNDSNENRIQDISYNSDGTLRQFTHSCRACDTWQISYVAYKSWSLYEQNFRLPSSITLLNVNTQAQIKLRISQWSESE
ncbi:lipoprotein insertase outer membrane protein LolB [Glaciecola petra]|uniref:Outer-membrane lipoprotein LolB n=1 Tax=Glaciecola petra TaxID=3075602 RepID=A0ABU2ZN02_9ALTE|nr:lipoprotein insertase outer membrane protein LolB [Aestuariibacter sp. P117]MDT0594001.1 lipoprotein insertase outer membrane protein LolB [Aestuariibacter sp. P117]